MVAVAPLVVQPGGRIAEKLALTLVGAAVALVVSRAGEEFGRAILGEVVKKTLPADARAKAMRHYLMPMARDGDKMQKRMCHAQNILSRSKPRARSTALAISIAPVWLGWMRSQAI